MELKIEWTPEEVKSFNRVIGFLEEKWTDREVKNFVEKTQKNIHLLSQGQSKFRLVKEPDIHELLITKHNLLIYKHTKDKIIILLIFDTRQHPLKKKWR